LNALNMLHANGACGSTWRSQEANGGKNWFILQTFVFAALSISLRFEALQGIETIRKSIGTRTKWDLRRSIFKRSSSIAAVGNCALLEF
jgi:hexokinase